MSAAQDNGGSPLAPPVPQPTLAVGVTGHRSAHPSYPEDASGLKDAIDGLLAHIERAAKGTHIHGHRDPEARFRLVSLLADGVDQLAAAAALERDWALYAPLPFGADLNTALACAPENLSDARAILAGKAPQDARAARAAERTRALVRAAHTFEIAERDAVIEKALLRTLEGPEKSEHHARLQHEIAHRARIAGQVLIEQCDLLIAVWDGESAINLGGSGDTARRALEAGVPVIWIDPQDPASLRLIRVPEALEVGAPTLGDGEVEGAVRSVIEAAIGLSQPPVQGSEAGLTALSQAAWCDTSSRFSHAFRRVEALFGESTLSGKLAPLRQRYERPDEVSNGAHAPLLAAIEGLGENGIGLRREVETKALPAFAWSDGIATWMADRYRSGMVMNFTLGPLAIISGVLYLPLVETSQKWIFAAIELTLLFIIVANTVVGQRLRLHDRWLETRRVAEYLRHTAMLYVFGVARPAGQWPAALRSPWPEWYARMAVRDLGLPQTRIDAAYLRTATLALRDHFVEPQRAYHAAKSTRLHRAHHSIERVAEGFFALAILIVATYVALSGGAALGLVDPDTTKGLAKWFTVVAIALPTISGALTAIGFFGDFDHFADVSQVTAQGLDALSQRIAAFLDRPDDALTYDQFADLARRADAIAFDEIQAWQSVFSGKRITVPA